MRPVVQSRVSRPNLDDPSQLGGDLRPPYVKTDPHHQQIPLRPGSPPAHPSHSVPSNPVPPVSRPINKECPDRTWPHRIPSRLFDLGHWTSDLGLRACPVPSAPTAVRGWVTDFVGHLL